MAKEHEKKSGQSRSVKLSRELAKIPIDKYRLAEDGRKWKAISRDRMGLAEFLGKHGDGDGTRIFVSIQTMMLHFGWSRRKVCYLLEDLRVLLLLEDTPNYSSAKHHRTRVRQLNVAAFLARTPDPLPPKPDQDSGSGNGSRVQDTNGQECKIESQECKIDEGVQNSGVQDSHAGVHNTQTGVHDSTQGVQDRGSGVHSNDAHNRHLTDTQTVTTDRHLTDTQNRAAETAALGVQIIALPEWVPVPQWVEFLKFRKQHKKPLNHYAQEIALKQLSQLRADCNDPAAVLEQSILNSWPGLYPVKPDPNTRDRRILEAFGVTKRRIIGPAGRTTEDHIERMRKNAITLGLKPPSE